MVERERPGRQRWVTAAVVGSVLLAVLWGPTLVVEMLKPRGQAVEDAREWVRQTAFRLQKAIEDSPSTSSVEWKQEAARALIGPPGDRHKGEFRAPVENPDGTVSYFMYVVASGTQGGGWVGQTAYALMCVELVVDARAEGTVGIESADCTDEVRGWTDYDVEADYS